METRANQPRPPGKATIDEGDSNMSQVHPVDDDDEPVDPSLESSRQPPNKEKDKPYVDPQSHFLSDCLIFLIYQSGNLRNSPHWIHYWINFYLSLSAGMVGLNLVSFGIHSCFHIDPCFISSFLLTYRRICTPRSVLLAMQKKMRLLDEPSGDPMFSCFAQMRWV